MEKKEMETMFSAVSKYLAVQCNGTGIEHQLAVLRKNDFIENKINYGLSVKSTAHTKPVVI
jgi:hypothetical protein